MTQDQIKVAAQRVALTEQAVQAAESEAKAASERQSALFVRRDGIAKEISKIRGNRPANELTDTDAARVHVLGLDAIDILPLIEQAANAVHEANIKLNAESMALGVAQRDFRMATKRVELEAVEAKAREAEKVMMRAIAELGALKREAGFNWRTGSDVYRIGYDADRFVRLGVVPPAEGA